MSVLAQPVLWLELAILAALLGALCVGRLRDPLRAWLWGLAFTAAALACAMLACLGYYLSRANGLEADGGAHTDLLGRQLLHIDELNAPLLPMAALLHFLTALATGRTKMRRYSLSWSLASEAIRLTAFGCAEPGLLIGMLALGTVPGYVELLNRRKPTQVYLLHMALFVGLLALGWVFYPRGGLTRTAWATVPLLAAVLIRCGGVPTHCWLTDWFEHASFGNALLFVTPLTGVYAAVRLVLPVAPDWALQSLSLASLLTAVYAAGMATVQREARRFFAYLFLSHASLVLVGLGLHTPVSLTGALALWVAVALALHGFGLTLRALEARFGRLSLADFHGLYEQSPALAMCFLLTGLASVGFPGTLGFVAAELLVDGAAEASPYVALAVALAGALNGIAVLRVYFLLFTGARHASSVRLLVGRRERLAILTLAALILGGGLVPQRGVLSRHRAALDVLRTRDGSGAAANQDPRPPAAE
ncbi:MAG TPA: proton-conducting transporter membrane subunit [Gemmataceae bacterium]|jgi:NADH-quinone oxidoreductase subunit M